jgi:hypothetical protein
VKKVWLVLFCFTLIGVMAWQLYLSQEIKVSAGNQTILMPRRDKQRLEYLFKELCLREPFAYTLLHQKPLSLGSYCKPFSSFAGFFPHEITKYLGWKTWLKYQDHLAHPNFTLWEEENPWNRGNFLILLADRPQVAAETAKHESDFRLILGENFHRDILADIEKKPFFSETLKQHDGLIGTLLGYGRDNAWLYAERDVKPLIELFGIWEPEIDQFMLAQLSIDFTRWFKSEPLSTLLFYPSFVADPNSEETVALKTKYRAARQKILDYYEGKDFLEATLFLLCSK